MKESFIYYKQWGRKNKPTTKLRFTKSGDEKIERRYAIHYVKKEMKVDAEKKNN